jgi:PAS domain S-box-containing protein
MKTSLKVFIAFLLLCMIAARAEVSGNPGTKDQIRRIDSLNNIAWLSSDNNTTLAWHIASKALSMASQSDYQKGQIDAWNTLSKINLANGEYLIALEQYFKIIDIYEQLHDTSNLVLSYGRIVQFYLFIKDYEMADKYLDITEKLTPGSAGRELQGQFHLMKARSYLATGKIDLSIRSAFLSLYSFASEKKPLLESASYKFLGDAFVQKKLYSLAVFNYRLAIARLNVAHDSGETAVLYTRLAHISQVLGNHEMNLRYNLAALRIREKLGRPLFIAYSCLNVGEAYWFLRQKDSASYFLQKSLRIAEQLKRPSLLEALYQQLSEFAKAENRHEDALKYFMSCIEYRDIMTQEANRADYMVLEANRAIRASEAENELLSQDILLQNLNLAKNQLEIFLFEVLLIIMFFMILIVDSIVRKNRKRKNELKELNERLVQEINIRIEAESRLKRSEELHRFLAENTVDVISLMDAGLSRLYISPSCEKFYGYSQQEILSMRTPMDLIEPAYHVPVNQRLIEMFRSKRSTRFVYKCMRKDGSVFWAEANINPILDPATHEVKNLITVVRNISERMKHEEELSEYARQKEYLLREIHNRVKNNFAILISLMNMQRDQSGNTELSSSLTDLQLRVRTMSLVHEQLYQNQEISTIPFDNYLHHLTLIISSSFNNPRIRLQTEIHPCRVAIEMALPLGLILNELITNAYKYAFPGDKTGTIWVRLSPENDQKFSISICDDGIGLPEDFSMNSTQSMGSQIVGILLEQIEASLKVTSAGGACFRILFSTLQEK